MYSVCVDVEGLYCVWVSKACRVCVVIEGLIGCVGVEGLLGMWVSNACRVCGCRRLVGCVLVLKACSVGVEGL